MQPSEGGVAAEGAGFGALRKVLLADDSAIQRRILGSVLRQWGLEVIEAPDGRVALDMARKHQPELILSDWMMPHMDGLSLCRAYRELKLERYGYFILLTSRTDKEDIAAGLESGADDFLTKPFDRTELRARIAAGARLVTMQAELARKNAEITRTLAELQQAHAALDRDIANARKIQQALMPDRTGCFGESRVSALLEPCGHVGGDLVGMFSPAWPLIGFYSVDVSGHGITSALMTARVAGYLAAGYPRQNVAMRRVMDGYYGLYRPEEVARELNDRFTVDLGIDEYFTMAYAVVNQFTGQMDAVVAGHPLPLILRRGGRIEEVGAGGVPIGLMPSMSYESVSVQLRPGDRVLLYTDGFTECVMKDGQMLGEAGLERLLRQVADAPTGSEFLNDLFWELKRQAHPDEGLADDVSAVLLEYRCAGPPDG